ncbi:hypothetical protein GSI_14239 [Ganoderma sinense ZZ0214-1]|uniref:DUF6532 domain-containing protein n=1 Tax=Ganoderma sinense ZZ0214-1 TaxID=1077348 RepID=A0A2G8RSL6_9APHY|nr:hypothetical protein GSI_14239 [Ganoderma sinense ZZ0214-1]
MARHAPAPTDPDESDIPPDQTTTEDGNGKPVRRSAQGAHKVWEELKPKSRALKPEHDGEKKKKGNTSAKPGGMKVAAPSGRLLATKYPAPSIDLDTSNDESPPPRARPSKRASATSSDEGSGNELDVEDEASVKSKKTLFGHPKGKDKASNYQSADEGSSDSGEGERLEDEDDEEESGPSELEELEEKDPSALQAKFDSEAPTWIDGDDHDFDGDLNLFSPSPVLSPRPVATNLDTIDRSPSKRPRAVLSDASENEEDVRPEPRPTKKKAKAVTSTANGEDADEGAPSMDEQTDLARDKAAERKRARKREEERKRKREGERERAKERERAEHAKERAEERERQRSDLKKLQEHAKECERRERQERKQEEERQRKKECEREKEREREKARERKLELALEMEREYEREHEEVRRQVLGKAKKHHGRDEHEREDKQNKRRDKAKTGSRPERSVGPSRSSTSNKTGSRTRTATSSSKGGHQAGVKTTARPPTKRKWGKQDEEVKFMSDKGSSSSDEERPSRKRRQDDEAVSESSSDEDNKNIDLIWLGNSRPNLTDQHPRVKQVANLAIADCELNVCTVNAFPDDPDGDGSFTRDILIKHAKALGYKDMVQKLKDRKDSTYWKKLSTIPSQRVFLLRGKVKGKCEGAVRAAYDLMIGDTEKVAWLQKDLAYIYPHDYKNRTVNGKEGFKPPIFENMLIASFFSRRQSYGHRISKHFKSSHPDKPDEKEIPAPMLALVSTAIFAAIDDFKHAHYDAAKFEVNLNLHVYRRNMAFLDHIKDKNIDAFHTLMHGLFKHVMGGVGGVSNNLGHGIGYLDVDGMDRS